MPKMVATSYAASVTLPQWRAYWDLCKPRVVGLMLLTALIGMFLASPGLVPLPTLCFGTLGIGLAAAAGAAINHLVDQHVDALMVRTRSRPIPAKQVTPLHAMLFAISLCVLAMVILVSFVNRLTAILTLLTFVGYAVVYTLFLKKATPQNIVIGGLASAMPPLLGWTAVTNHVSADSLLLVLIIFAWTPPHFWALAIERYQDYSKAKIPMLPVTHGIPFTQLTILLYSILLAVISLLPYATGMSGLMYLCAAIILNAIFLYYAILLKVTTRSGIAGKLFRYSIWYMGLLFIALLIDHQGFWVI